MKASELRGRERADLAREMEQLRRELFDLRFQWQAEEKADSSRRLRLRRDIARYKTVLREMERQQQTPAKREG
jgi:large subunit ribosomal protein L29